jgi:hypothetical protein
MPSAGLRPRSPSRWQCADGDSLAARWGREAVGPSSEDFVRWKASSIETFFFLAYNAQFISQLWLAIPISIVHLSFLIILLFFTDSESSSEGYQQLFLCRAAPPPSSSGIYPPSTTSITKLLLDQFQRVQLLRLLRVLDPFAKLALIATLYPQNPSKWLQKPRCPFRMLVHTRTTSLPQAQHSS